MLDINKLVTDPRAARLDPEGHLAELAPWSPRIAGQLAEAEGIALDDAHWAILFHLRERFRAQGPAPSGAALARELEAKFSGGRGRAVLYELFPGGPVSQGSRIAGLPAPPHSSDPSFGSVL